MEKSGILKNKLFLYLTEFFAAVIGFLGSSLRSPSGSAELASLGQSSPFFLRLPCDFTAR